MNGSEFGGVTARYYAQFRRGYPSVVVDRLVEVLGLDAGSRLLDLGCGPGTLTLPLARRVCVAVGADPEPDMLALGRQAGLTSGIDDVAWLLAADCDLNALGTLLGRGTLDAITVGCAFHWMDAATLSAGARDLMHAGGRIAVVTNGVADWEQDTPWARVLRDTLATRFGGPVRGHTGTGADSQRALIAAPTTAGFTGVDKTVVDRDSVNDRSAARPVTMGRIPRDLASRGRGAWPRRPSWTTSAAVVSAVVSALALRLTSAPVRHRASTVP